MGNSSAVIAIITDGQGVESNAYFMREYCVKELRWAIGANKFIQPVISSEDKQRIGEFPAQAPEDLKHLGKTNWLDLNRGDKDYWNLGLDKTIKDSLELDKEPKD